jgi:transposase-like protein
VLSGSDASPDRVACEPLIGQKRAEIQFSLLSGHFHVAHAHVKPHAIEGLNRQVRKAIKTRGHFPDEQAATKLIYLALMRAEVKWKKVMHWTAALRALKIHFGDRIPD